ncbi:uncharacterized protein LOC143651572 [Tamandua tetradactyla]|uniref:uncharacterized protein LOC143651572 n=1 Tax=Tamandua tetradactyla TaxID=48850 RepID=UPI0040538745
MTPASPPAVQPPEACDDPPARLDPLMAKADAIFFKVAPSEALVQNFVRQGLHVLWEAESLSVEMVISELDPPSSDASGQSDTSILRYVVALIVLSLLLFTISLALVLKWKACCPGFNLGVLKSHPQSCNAQ